MSNNNVSLLPENYRVNHLTFIKPLGFNKRQIMMILARCDCGEEVEIQLNHFLIGDIFSCGCIKRDSSIKYTEVEKGQRYGKLVVDKYEGKKELKNGRKVDIWSCNCDCGHRGFVAEYNLLSGNTKSCGCTNNPDLTGKKIYMLTVLERIGKKVNSNCKEVYWKCKCDCGNIIEQTTNELLSGRIVSCGCYLKNRISPNKSHGDSDSYLYSKWFHMKSRCYSVNAGNYPRYGGRGIRVCDEWKNSYEAFKKWAYLNGYDPNSSEKLTVDRLDPNDDYCPENCRWIPLREQGKTTRKSVKEYKGKLISDYCKEVGIEECIVRQRILDGWKIPDAIYLPKNAKKPNYSKD